jgi:hypothetical protein
MRDADIKDLIGEAFPIGATVRLKAEPDRRAGRTYVAEAGAIARITGEAFTLPSGRYVQRLNWIDPARAYHQNDGAYSVVDFEIAS